MVAVRAIKHLGYLWLYSLGWRLGLLLPLTHILIRENIKDVKIMH